MREGWKEVRLADYYDISSGLSKPAKDFGSGYPFLSFKDIFHNYFVPKELSQLVKSDEKEQVKCSVKKGDIFLTRTSETIEELGMSCVALKDYPNATFNGFSKRLRPKEHCPIDAKFIGFYLRSVQFRAEITAYSSLTTRASLNNGMINRLKIHLPPLPTQRKIANILSAYDDLIENNRRRIALLEEQAQQTYEEWFVRMRFPGFEEVEVVDGLPVGWRKGKLSHLVDFLSGFAFKSRKFTASGYPVIKIKNIGNNTIDTDNVVFIDEEYARKVNRFKLVPNDLLIAMTGATVGKVGFVPITEKPCYLNQRVGKFVAKKGINNIFLVGAILNHSYGYQQVVNYAQGAAQPNISANQILSVKCLVSPIEIQKRFYQTVKPNIDTINNLYFQNRLLQEARDILLPRLMLGMVDVEEVMKD